MQSYHDSPASCTDNDVSFRRKQTALQRNFDIDEDVLFPEPQRPRRSLQIVIGLAVSVLLVLLLHQTVAVFVALDKSGFKASPPPLDLSRDRWTAVHHHIPALSSSRASPMVESGPIVAATQTTLIRTVVSDMITTATVESEASTSMASSAPTGQVSAASKSPSTEATQSATPSNALPSSALPFLEQSTPGPLVRKALVVASLAEENTTWIRETFPDWDKNIYIVDDPDAEFTVARNAGHETSVYLTYIIDNYDNLPDYMVFLHADRYQWHVDDPMYDSIPTIKNLRLPWVETEGYVNLRCHWFEGCPEAVRPDEDYEENIFEIERTTYQAYRALFPNRPVPEVIGQTCCAQFAVSRETVLKRRRQGYQRMRQWLWKEGTKMLDAKSGRIFEHLWHIIFDKDDVYCPDAETCYCNVYGLCDLDCPHDGPYGQAEKCNGRYHQLNWDVTINSTTWPEEGQGIEGRPVDGWWEEYYPPELYDGFKLRERPSSRASVAAV